MSGTELAYCAVSSYAVPGTELAFGGIWSYALSGTELAYGTAARCELPRWRRRRRRRRRVHHAHGSKVSRARQPQVSAAYVVWR
eukprot:1872856-Rhodomonas_salina.2